MRTALRLVVMAAVVGATVLVAACGGDDAGSDGQPDDATSQPAPTATTARYFDPGALRPGDSFLDLRVSEVDVRRVFDDSVWVGRVVFDGVVTVTGEYRRHFDWPEPDALCFFVTAPASIARLPEFAPDSRTGPGQQTWFCFSNPERALELLGDGARPLRATIVVDRYMAIREFSDVVDIARLVEVVAAEP